MKRSKCAASCALAMTRSPAAEAPTVADLFKDYMDRHAKIYLREYDQTR
jgi:hypothetical protein